MEYLIHILILIAIYSVLSLTLNLVLGYTGMLSVAHAAFLGIGAYTTSILTVSYGFNFFLALGCGVIFAALAALIIGSFLSRFNGDFLALVSLGFTSIVWSCFLNLSSLTRGPLGIPGIPRPEIGSFVFASNTQFLALAVIFAVVTFFICKWIGESSFGRVLKAIREDEKALSVFGYRVDRFKLAVFVITGGIAAIAGGLYASYISFIDPSSFTVTASVFILSMTVLGGLGRPEGPVLGAALLIIMPEVFRYIGFSPDIAAQMRQLFYGLLLIVLMLKRTQGLIGQYKL